MRAERGSDDRRGIPARAAPSHRPLAPLCSPSSTTRPHRRKAAPASRCCAAGAARACSCCVDRRPPPAVCRRSSPSRPVRRVHTRPPHSGERSTPPRGGLSAGGAELRPLAGASRTPTRVALSCCRTGRAFAAARGRHRTRRRRGAVAAGGVDLPRPPIGSPIRRVRVGLVRDFPHGLVPEPRMGKSELLRTWSRACRRSRSRPLTRPDDFKASRFDECAVGRTPWHVDRPRSSGRTGFAVPRGELRFRERLCGCGCSDLAVPAPRQGRRAPPRLVW